MTAIELRKVVKVLVLEKGVNNILNGEVLDIVHKTGASLTQVENAINYFRYSPQAAKYRK